MSVDLRDLGDELFARYSPYRGLGFRHHCLRLSAFVDLLLAREKDPFPRDFVHLLAMVHDLGLVTPIDRGDNYLQRSVSLFERETQRVDLPVKDSTVVRQILLFNHRFFPQKPAPVVAECFRQAVWIEHTHGMKSYDLPQKAIQAVFRQFSRDNFDDVLMDFARRTLRREPLTIVRGIFF